MRVKLAARLRLERVVPQAKANTAAITSWRRAQGNSSMTMVTKKSGLPGDASMRTPLTGSSSSELPSSSAGSSSAVAASSAVVESSAALSPAAGECT